VLIEVRYIKKSFLRRARLPEIIKELEKASSDLSKCLSQWPDQRNQAKSLIKIAASLLKSTKKMLTNEEKQEIENKLQNLENAANASGNTKISQEDCWDLYSDILSALKTLEQLSKNIKWE
jgi:hypothetical protein